MRDNTVSFHSGVNVCDYKKKSQHLSGIGKGKYGRQWTKERVLLITVTAAAWYIGAAVR